MSKLQAENKLYFGQNELSETSDTDCMHVDAPHITDR